MSAVCSRSPAANAGSACSRVAVRRARVARRATATTERAPPRMRIDFIATRAPVKNRGSAPEDFLRELVDWASTADDGLFERNANIDIYSSVRKALGPWESLAHRRAVMLEVLRVLGGFESSWRWDCGRDTTNPTSDRPETEEAGLWQVSMNAIAYGEDLRQLTRAKIGTVGYSRGRTFQRAIKEDHRFAMEFIVRLLRHTTAHNGPAKRHEIDEWLSRDAVAEFQQALA